MCENKKYLQKNLHNSIICCNFVADFEKSQRRDARVVEEARLESV